MIKDKWNISHSHSVRYLYLLKIEESEIAHTLKYFIEESHSLTVKFTISLYLINWQIVLLTDLCGKLNVFNCRAPLKIFGAFLGNKTSVWESPAYFSNSVSPIKSFGGRSQSLLGQSFIRMLKTNPTFSTSNENT